MDHQSVSGRATREEREYVLPVDAYPSLRTAAKLIGVSPSALARRGDVRRDQERIPVGEVVRLAASYRRARVSRVAAFLVERAGSAGAEAQGSLPLRLTVRWSRFLRDLRVMTTAPETRRRLSKGRGGQVETTCKRDDKIGRSAVGWAPEV